MDDGEQRLIRICEFNLENLFVSMSYHEGHDLASLDEPEWRALALPQLKTRQKPLKKLWGVARALLEIDPDVAMLVEVGGRDSLENFNRHFLGDRYEPLFVEGNSTRGIDLAFLVRRGLPLTAEARSNRDTPVEVHRYRGGRETARFARDVAELRLMDARGRLRLLLLLVHLKSMLSTEQDFRGKDLRTAEAIALSEIYAERRAEFPAVPVVVGGDFNAQLSSLELELIHRTDLVDFHDLLATPAQDRISLVHFDTADRPRHQTVDYLLISPELRECVVPEGSFTWRHRSFHGVIEGLPASSRERHRMPSDHYPVVLTVRLPELAQAT
jgi:endonuclease/exonuclease/phosphatase family metal-dependent hydrolase